MPMIETPLMRGLERVLDRSAFRHQVIATNLANVDTPGFRTRDVREFAVEPERAEDFAVDLAHQRSHPLGRHAFMRQSIGDRLRPLL